MKKGEVLFQGPSHHKKISKKCDISVPGIYPKFGERWDLLSELGQMEKILKND